MGYLILNHSQQLKVAVLTPLKLRHRYFIKTLSKNQLKIEFIVKHKHDRNLFSQLTNLFSISSFLNLFNTFFEIFHFGWIYKIDVPIISVTKYSDILKLNLTPIKKIDVFLVYGGPIISKEILKNLKSIFLNVHGAYLPGYRGLDSHWWLYLEKKSYLQGYTIHFVNEKLDAGKILKTNKFDSSLIGPKRLLLWRLWIARNSALDLVGLLREPQNYQNPISHNIDLSVYRSSLTFSNWIMYKKKSQDPKPNDFQK